MKPWNSKAGEVERGFVECVESASLGVSQPTRSLREGAARQSSLSLSLSLSGSGAVGVKMEPTNFVADALFPQPGVQHYCNCTLYNTFSPLYSSCPQDLLGSIFLAFVVGLPTPPYLYSIRRHRLFYALSYCIVRLLSLTVVVL